MITTISIIIIIIEIIISSHQCYRCVYTTHIQHTQTHASKSLARKTYFTF